MNARSEKVKAATSHLRYVHPKKKRNKMQNIILKTSILTRFHLSPSERVQSDTWQTVDARTTFVIFFLHKIQSYSHKIFPPTIEAKLRRSWTLLNIILHYFALLYTIVQYYCTVFYSIVQYYFTVFYSILQYYCKLLDNTIVHYFTVFYSIVHYCILLYTVVHYCTLLYSILLYSFSIKSM